MIKKEASGGVTDGKYKSSGGLHEGIASQPQVFATSNDYVPPPPTLDIAPGTQISVTDIQKNLNNLLEYNVILREKLVLAQSMLLALSTNAPSSSAEKS